MCVPVTPDRNLYKTSLWGLRDSSYKTFTEMKTRTVIVFPHFLYLHLCPTVTDGWVLITVYAMALTKRLRTVLPNKQLSLGGTQDIHNVPHQFELSLLQALVLISYIPVKDLINVCPLKLQAKRVTALQRFLRVHNVRGCISMR